MNTPTAPCSLDAERGLLGSVLLDNDALLLMEALPADFYYERHGDILYAMQSLQAEGKPIDFITLSARLESSNKLKGIGGQEYLVTLAQEVPTASNVAHYSDLVVQSAFQRKLLSAAGQIADLAYNHKELSRDELEVQAHRVLMGLSNGNGKDGLLLAEAITEFIPELQEYLNGQRDVWGVPTGLCDLDTYIGGLAYGEMTLIAADPAMGKTSLAMTVAFHAASQNYAGVIFSLEMKRRQLMLRFFAERGDVDTATIRRGKMTPPQIEKMWDSVDRVSNIPLWIYDEPKDTAAIQRDIMRLSRRLEAQGSKLHFAIVDYSDLLTDKHENEVVRQKHLSHNLKIVAKRTGVAMGVVHTLTRDAAKQEEPPELHHLGWGRAWEFDAHTVLFPFFSKKRCDQKGLIKVGKYRDGITGRAIDAIFDGRRWRNAERRLP